MPKKTTPNSKDKTINQKPITFYYEQKQIICLTFVYAFITVLVYIISKSIIDTPLSNNLVLDIFLIILMLISLSALASVVFVLLLPQTLAIIDDKGIKIDHNATLKWSDISLAKEQQTSTISKRKIISLIVKPNTHYKLTFMQRLCQFNIYTPFSIPLYAMDKESAEKIKDLIKKKVKKYEVA